MEQELIRNLVAQGHLRPDQHERLLGLARYNHTPIGMIALGYAAMSMEQIDHALARQQETGERFGEAAVVLGALTGEQVERLLDVQRFRRAAHVVEAATLSGLLSFSDAISSFGQFLCRQAESSLACAQK